MDLSLPDILLTAFLVLNTSFCRLTMAGIMKHRDGMIDSLAFQTLDVFELHFFIQLLALKCWKFSTLGLEKGKKLLWLLPGREVEPSFRRVHLKFITRFAGWGHLYWSLAVLILTGH